MIANLLQRLHPFTDFLMRVLPVIR